ncbi:hypothetical protein [Actinomadura atramentaria]|uniref:hypothetical protein n=1 Tax=Actinomadura atramentaria TaxID=1990 RepID=UPI0003714F10|nr:hypothetical protein [Actinomadura atramentaria]
MKAPGKIGTTTLAACAVIGLAAVPASAGTTTVRKDSATGAAYSGAYQIVNVGNLTFSGSGISASCSSADLRGTLTSTGSGTLDSAAVSGCSSSLGTPTVTFRNLPYTDGALVYGPSGTYDALLTFTDSDLQIEANFAGLSCVYGFDATHTKLTFEVRNPDNAANSTGQLAGTMNNVSLGLKSGSFLCPTGVVANGTGTAKGKVTSTSTTYTQKLYVTS